MVAARTRSLGAAGAALVASAGLGGGVLGPRWWRRPGWAVACSGRAGGVGRVWTAAWPGHV
ncbi:hypothetical protein [Pseudonocardia endophytica]|uniref:hypothetical protein n=1 Tax=Pseudonocardia endophytica TaxID=401976 RepID=UPI001053115F|nr:hypothetical protein [Pseudonocardia endophytica]